VLALAVAAAPSCKSGTPTAPAGAKELNSGDFGRGGTFQHRFAAAGTYAYHCIHHSPMRGTVQVTDAAPDTLVNVNIVNSMAPFPAASVKPGGRVLWTNNTGDVHTVTSD
jgi:plastocyanin